MRTKIIGGWSSTLIGLLVAGGCSPEAPAISQDTAAATAAVVYGTDDRVDYYEANATQQARTRESIVALVRSANVDASDPSDVQLMGDTLQEAMRLCASERFLDQPAASHCSGTLIDDDLVLTAGHCFKDDDVDAECRDTRFVFNYFYESAGTLATIVASQDVYSCRRVVVRRNEEPGREIHDYAIVQLDRPVHESHVPAPVRTESGAVARGTAVTIIGFGSGIPAKVDAGGRVTDSRSATLDYFRATTDAFGGNSGSGIFAPSGDLVGVLHGGADDYTESGDCYVVNVLSESEDQTDGEIAYYGFRAVAALCAASWPSERLCGMAAVCGDSVCSGTETHADCPADCPAPTCGDGICEGDEDATSCSEDCEPIVSAVPAEWTCPPGYYNGRDGCDCECGAYDPDCGVVGQAVSNCEPGQTCGATGVCEGMAIDLPAGWTCDPRYYDANDGCDCDCGAYDPDCDADAAELYNCDPGEVCDASGQCTDEDTPEPDAGVDPDPDAGVTPRPDSGVTPEESGGGCSAGGSSPAAPTGAGLLGMMLGLAVWRRRSRARR